jgi:5-methylcytosine-specific restriction endonuclease McrA
MRRLKLNPQEKLARTMLIQVADGTMQTRKPGLISYSELWTLISSIPCGRWHYKKLVRMLTTISAYDIARGRPPLNELVVPKASGKVEPEIAWSDIQFFLKSQFGVVACYSSHSEAQEACWRYWGRKAQQPNDDNAVEEGLKQDRTRMFHSRNRSIIQRRKDLDKYTCQSCQFRLKIGRIWIIDCHHKYPFGLNDGVRITRINDLMCLCPTCHRIAHTRNPPCNLEEIRRIRGIM